MLQYSGVYLELYFQLINDVFFTTMKKKSDILFKIAIDNKVPESKAMEYKSRLSMINCNIFRLF